MQDSISVLSHATLPLAKTWKADGNILPYGDGKYFTYKKVEIASIHDLSRILGKLEKRQKSCVIRGSYIGDEKAKLLDLEFNVGKVRRIIDVYEDTPHHWLLVEVDGFEPVVSDPVNDPIGAITEYIETSLPECFHHVSYHFQLSNSAGHIKHAGKLKAHIWFWLSTAYNSDQIKQWASVENIDLDRSVLNVVQVHYTALPMFEDGVEDPVKIRSGFVEGLMSDEVALVLDEDLLKSVAAGSGKTKVERLNQIAKSDARAMLLYERDMVKSVGRSGELRITCPRESEHSGDSGESSTVYYLPNTGGYEVGHFVCKHAHCSGVPQSLFDAALGFDEFEVLGDNDDIEVEKIKKKVKNNSKSEIAKLLSSNFDTTDLANATRLIKSFKGEVLYSGGRFLAYNGKCWSSEASESYFRGTRLSSIIIREADVYIGKAKTTAGEAAEKLTKRAAALYKWAARSEMKGTMEAAMSIVSKMLEVPSTKFNANPRLINANNGTFDAATGELRPHSKDDYIIDVSIFDYVKNQKSEVFLTVVRQTFLEDIKYLVGEATVKSDYFLRFMGYCMTALTNEQVMLICYGGGRNGKSTLIDAITSTMGSMAGTAAPGLLIGGGENRHPTEIADLEGKRLVIAHESADGAPLNEAFVKRATGSDKMSARRMRGDFFEFIPGHKFAVLTNHIPTVKSQDDGIWRRLRVLLFAAKFGTQEELDAGVATHLRDTSIPERLVGEREALFSMLCDEAYKYVNEGLDTPECVRLESLRYKESQDRMKAFVDECCEVGVEYRAPLSGDFGAVYPEYQSWCKESGIMPLGKNKAVDELFRVVPELTKTSGKQNRKDGGRNKVTWINGLKIVGDV